MKIRSFHFTCQMASHSIRGRRLYERERRLRPITSTTSAWRQKAVHFESMSPSRVLQPPKRRSLLTSRLSVYGKHAWIVRGARLPDVWTT